MKLKKAISPAFTFVLCGIAVAFSTKISQAQHITIDTSSAHAVIDALRDPHLTFERSMQIAKLEGNQGMIKEMRHLGEADTDEQFARALVASAHGVTADTHQERSYFFDDVKKDSAAIELRLSVIEADFEAATTTRLRPFSPAGLKTSIRGFVVAGGDGGGYAFDTPEFYINIVKNDDLVFAKQVACHEAFHGVQGAVFQENTDRWLLTTGSEAERTRGAFCSNVAKLFVDMRNEGTASLVGDPELVREAKGLIGKRMYEEGLYGSAHLPDSSNLLEVSIASLQAPNPVPYKKVYSVDFFGRGVVYYISLAMAQAIEKESGPSAIASVIQKSGYEFVLQYTRLSSYGKDALHPKLGDNTVQAAKLLERSCMD